MSAPRLAACALSIAALTGCGGAPGGSHGPAAPAGPKVSLDLKAGGSGHLTACGVLHHYTVYGHVPLIEYAGIATPLPAQRFKVKLKVKRCGGGTFSDVAEFTAQHDKHTGKYAGVIQVPGPGRYFARASLYIGGRRVTRSDKRYFSVR